MNYIKYFYYNKNIYKNSFAETSAITNFISMDHTPNKDYTNAKF